MKAPGLNLGGLLDRLGIQTRGAPPDIAPAVFPVVVVADGSPVVPPIRGASAWLGIELATTAGNPAAWRIISAAEGGLWIRFLSLQGGTSVSLMTFYVGSLEQPGNPFVPVTPGTDPYLQLILRTADTMQMTPQRVTSELKCGEGYAAPAVIANVHPTVHLAALTRQTYLYNFFLPPGWVLYGESSLSSGNLTRVDLVIDEVTTVSTQRT